MAKKKKEEISIITKNAEAITKAMDLKLEDLEGIGTVRLKKLHTNGIFTVDDLASKGEEELIRLLEITWGDASKMIQIANENIRKDSVMSKMFVSGSDFKKHRKENIKYLTTGLKELDEILKNKNDKKNNSKGGYETGVITEFYGGLGSGKTQFVTLACIMAQMPAKPCCLGCGRTDETKTCECKDIWWEGGGLSEWNKPCRVVYIDTENSFRPERFESMIYNRELVLTKPQTKTQIKQDADKEPLDEKEEKRAGKFLDNLTYSRPFSSAMQMATISALGSVINGDFCKHCGIREIDENLIPTHQNHPKAKEDMELQEHDFEKNVPAKLVVVDSIISEFRKDFEGRGQLSDRQSKLKTHIKHLVRTTETKNVVCIITNQVQEVQGLAGVHADNVRSVGGNELGHTATHIIYLKKPQSVKANKITAILVDSPNNAKNEINLELGSKGVQELPP